MSIDEIRSAIKRGKIRISDHAYNEAVEDQLSLSMIIQSVEEGEIIKTYPDDRPYPSCLIFGKSGGDVPIHSVWGYNKEAKSTVLVTVYRPDPNRWINWRKRKDHE